MADNDQIMDHEKNLSIHYNSANEKVGPWYCRKRREEFLIITLRRNRGTWRPHDQKLSRPSGSFLPSLNCAASPALSLALSISTTPATTPLGLVRCVSGVDSNPTQH